MSNDNYKKTGKSTATKGGDFTQQESEFDYIEPVQAQPLEVKVYGGNFDRAMRSFRSIVQKERILSIYKEKQSYEKPSQKRRRKRNEMKRKLMELENDRGDEKSSRSSKH